MKRFLIGILVCVSLTGLWAGGSSQNSGSKTTVPMSGAPPGTLPIVKEPTTLRLFYPQAPQVLDFVDNKFTKFLEKQTGIKVEWDLVPADQRTAKLNLMLATGQGLPDVFVGGMDSSTLVDYGAQGYFVPLNDYIDKTSKWFKDVLKVHPELLNMMAGPDGKIYSLPQISETEPNQMSSRMWINQPWLTKLGLSMPTTTEEFRNVLRAFKTRDPNGNGKADEIPLIGAYTGWGCMVDTFIMNAFLQYPTESTGLGARRYVVRNNKVEPVFTKEEYRDGIKYMNELVMEGLLDTSTFTLDANRLKQIYENPDVALIGAVSAGAATTIGDVANSRRFRDYEALPPLKGPKGVQYSYWHPYNYYQIPNAWVISSTCKNPEAAFRFGDYFFNPEVSMFSRLGEPGTDYIPNPPGKKAVDGGEALYRPVLVWGSQQKSHWQNNNPAYNFFANKLEVSDDPYETQIFLWNAMLKYKPYCPPRENCIPPLVFTPNEASEYNNIMTALAQYIDETRVRWITSGGIDREWAGYLSELDKIGLKRVTEITQAAYNRFANAK